ncbi:MAG: hypothetical protein V2G33_05210 [bacterium JZ-2024 1]
MSEPVFDPIGIVLAGVFILVLIVLLVEMLQLPRALTREAARAVHSLDVVHSILVPLQEEVGGDLRSMELACRIAKEQKARVVGAYILEVPMLMPMDAPMEEEPKADFLLHRAQEIAEIHNLPFHPVKRRSRNLVHEYENLIEKEGIRLAIIGLPPTRIALAEPFPGWVRAFLQKVHCEVIIIRYPS